MFVCETTFSPSLALVRPVTTPWPDLPLLSPAADVIDTLDTTPLPAKKRHQNGVSLTKVKAQHHSPAAASVAATAPGAMGRPAHRRAIGNCRIRKQGDIVAHRGSNYTCCKPQSLRQQERTHDQSQGGTGGAKPSGWSQFLGDWGPRRRCAIHGYLGQKQAEGLPRPEGRKGPARACPREVMSQDAPPTKQPASGQPATTQFRIPELRKLSRREPHCAVSRRDVWCKPT